MLYFIDHYYGGARTKVFQVGKLSGSKLEEVYNKLSLSLTNFMTGFTGSQIE
jgi:hypothetical protein